MLLSLVYLFSYTGKKNGETIKGNGEFWFGSKEKIDNIYDIRALEKAVSTTENLIDVVVDGTLTPLRHVERNGQAVVFYRKGEPVEEPAIPEPRT